MNPLGPTIGDAILCIMPLAKFVVSQEDIDNIEWHPDTANPPSKDKILEALETLRNNKEIEKYKVLRSNSYPSIGDQLDALFHAGIFPEEMANKIQEIKNRYPKASE
jgi:hypothetical protein